MADNVAEAVIHTSDEAHKRLRKRYRSERNFKALGALAILFAVGALVALLWTVVSKAVGTVHQTYLVLDTPLEQSEIDPKKTADPATIRKADFEGLVKGVLRNAFPTIKGRREKRELYQLVSDGASLDLRTAVMENPALIGTTRKSDLLASDDADLWLKGYSGKIEEIEAKGALSLSDKTGSITIDSSGNSFDVIVKTIKTDMFRQAKRLYDQADAQDRGVKLYTKRLAAAKNDELRIQYQAELKKFEAAKANYIAQAKAMEVAAKSEEGLVNLNSSLPSYFVDMNGGVIKIAKASINKLEGDVLLPIQGETSASQGQWKLLTIQNSEASRKINDRQVMMLRRLEQDGKVKKVTNWRFLTDSDSREPEMAGLLGAMIGSFFTMMVTFFLAFPVGVLSAIYLEEFAPKNRFTAFIEVNINNLAAVPSIVFGLLGLAVFLTFFGIPRSVPLAGGLVLALMTLPTIIIASRAAIKAVPPSIREAAIGVGASKVQAVFHHVLPLAMPGILTGTIIGMAQALGETAPLIMIGMVAFIKDVPGSVLEPASVLPVQVFRWSDFPERAFEMKTAAAILVLLIFLVLMNALAVLLRKRFERRW